MKIAVIAGHDPEKRGAARGLVDEYGLSSAIAGDLVFRLSKTGNDAWLIGAGTNAAQAKAVNALKPDIGVEIHFNNHENKNIHGTEVLHAGSDNGKFLAECVQKQLVKHLKTKDRGAKIGYYQGNPENKVIDILRKTNCPFVVPEPLFLSNDEDFSKIDIPLISIAIHEAIEYYEQILKR